MKRFVLLACIAFAHVEGLRLKTERKDNKDAKVKSHMDLNNAPKDMEEPIAQRQTDAELQAVVNCADDVVYAVTEANWKAWGYDGRLTNTNYCHCTQADRCTDYEAKFFCFWRTNTEAKCRRTTDRTQCNRYMGVDHQNSVVKDVFPSTVEGWDWDLLSYDAQFKCGSKYTWNSATQKFDDPQPKETPWLSFQHRTSDTQRKDLNSVLTPTGALDMSKWNTNMYPNTGMTGWATGSCGGPRPSDTCLSNSAYCWGGTEINLDTFPGVHAKQGGKCYDVMSDPDVCLFAPNMASGRKGKDTDDGWNWHELNYDIRAACFTQSWNNPVLEAYIPDDIVEDQRPSAEPIRQVFMQRYTLWCQFNGWKNNKQLDIARTGRTLNKATNLDCDIGRYDMAYLQR